MKGKIRREKIEMGLVLGSKDWAKSSHKNKIKNNIDNNSTNGY